MERVDVGKVSADGEVVVVSDSNKNLWLRIAEVFEITGDRNDEISVFELSEVIGRRGWGETSNTLVTVLKAMGRGAVTTRLGYTGRCRAVSHVCGVRLCGIPEKTTRPDLKRKAADALLGPELFWGGAEMVMNVMRYSLKEFDGKKFKVDLSWPRGFESAMPPNFVDEIGSFLTAVAQHGALFATIKEAEEAEEEMSKAGDRAVEVLNSLTKAKKSFRAEAVCSVCGHSKERSCDTMCICTESEIDLTGDSSDDE